MICLPFSPLTTFRYNAYYIQLNLEEALEEEVALKICSCTKILSVEDKVNDEEEEYLLDFLSILNSEVY